jgi:uncharacterized protein (TIRG00374 family)
MLHHSMKRTWSLIISVVLTAVIGYVLYRSVPDWGQAAAIMISGKPQWFLAGICFVAIHMFLRALRWGILLIPVKSGIPLKRLLSVTIIKYVINVIPPRVGEIAGAVLLARKEKIPSSSVIASSLFERVCDALAVLAIFSFYLFFCAGWYTPTSARGQEIFEIIRTSTQIGIVAIAGLLIFLLLFLRSKRWHDRVPEIVRKHVLGFADGLRSIQNWSAAIKVGVLSILIWLSISAQLWCFTRAYLDVFPFTGALFIMAITVVGVAIPTPGGVGGFQFFMVVGLIHFFRPFLPGLDPESQAGGISNGVYLLSMGPIILLGLVLLHREGISLAATLKDAEIQ